MPVSLSYLFPYSSFWLRLRNNELLQFCPFLSKFAYVESFLKKKKEITWNVVSVRIIIIIKKKITLLKLYFRNKSERVTTVGSFYNSHAPSGVKCRKQSERGEASSSRFEHQQRVVSRNSLVVERFLPGWRHELSPPGTAFVDNHSSTTSQRYK